jgi:hypothetical protein
VGPRLPARLPRGGAAARASPAGAARCLDRDRRSPDSQGSVEPARPRGGPGLRLELRPSQHQVRGRAQGLGARAALLILAGPPRGRFGHRLLPEPQEDGGDRRVPPAQRHRRTTPG